MLRNDIQQFVSRSISKTLEDLIARAREREIDLEIERKINPNQAQVLGGSIKRLKVFDLRSGGQ